MADNIEVGDLVARISLDDTVINKSIAQIQREMKLVASEFDKASAQLGAFASEGDKLRAQSERLTKEIALQGQRVELLRQEFRKVAQEKGEDAVATQKLAIQLNKAEAALNSMQTELKQVNNELADQPSRMTKWSKSLQDVGNHLQSAGQEIATSFGVAGAALSTALGFAVNTAADFEAQMDRVGAIADSSTEDLNAMSDAALDLGATTSKSASEVAEGMEMMAAMGFQANEIISAMPGVIAAAEASGQDMALVADTMAVALRSFGLEASQATHVADVLAKTANTSAADIEGMAYVLKYAAGPADTLGVSLEELAASAALMADAGIRGETAGTTLRSALLSLTAPSKEASKQLDDLNVKVTDSQGNMLPFADIISQIKAGMEGWGNAQKAAALETLFGKEAVSGMMAVIDAGPQKLQALTKELQNSTGASAEAAEQMKDNFKGAMDELNGAFETAQITIGNALIPAIQSLAGAVQSVVNWFNELNPATQQLIAVSAAAGAALLTLVGALGGIMAVVGMAATGFGALGISLGAVSAAILPVTAAIAGLTAAGILLYQNWDTIKAYAIEVWGSIKGYVMPIVDEVAGFIRETFGGLAEWWRQVWPDLQQAFMNIWDGIAAAVGPKLEVIKEIFAAVWPYIQNIVVAAWETMKGVITATLDIITGIVGAFAALFTGNWEMLWANIKQILSGAWNAMQSIISGGVRIVLNILGGLVASIMTYFQQIARDMIIYGNNMVQGLGQGIMAMATWIKEKVLAFVNMIADTIKGFFGIASPSTLMAEYGRYLVEGLWEGINSMVEWITEKVTSFSAGVADTIKQFFGIASPSTLMIEYGEYIAQGLAVGIENKTGEAVGKAQALAQGVIAAVQAAAAAISNLAGSTMPDWLDIVGSSGGGGGGGSSGGYGPDDSWDPTPDGNVIGDNNGGGAPDPIYGDDVDKEGAYQKPGDIFGGFPPGYEPPWERDDDPTDNGGPADDTPRTDHSGETSDDWEDPPWLAEGGTITRSGLALVGEKGPELLNLPKGAQVIPNYELPRVGGAAIDYDRLAQSLARHIKPSITQYNTFHSPQPLSPSETARKNLQVSRQLALEWGLR